ncbi:MAG: VOC family protein [Beijerinckiaceae bacterium]
MSRRLDHVALAARDLAAQAEAFRRMGFRIGARNLHPWGTQNHVIQFADTFLELICAPEPYHAPVDPDPRVFSFAAFVHDFVQSREGAAMIALTGDDPEADARAFRSQDLGDYEPFHFERRGKRADGSLAHVAFTLAFAHSRAMPAVGFFTCRHKRPESFWDKGLQDHANGASGLCKVTIVAENPADHGEFLSHFTGVRDYRSSSMGLEFTLEGEQTLEVVTPLAFGFKYGPQAHAVSPGGPHVAALELRTTSLGLAAEALTGGRIPFAKHQGRIITPASAAFGVTLAFAPG